MRLKYLAFLGVPLCALLFWIFLIPPLQQYQEVQIPADTLVEKALARRRLETAQSHGPAKETPSKKDTVLG